MNPRMLMTAIPWLRRLWKVLPAPMRLPLLVVAAGAGLYYAITNRDELKDAIQEATDGGSDDESSQAA